MGRRNKARRNRSSFDLDGDDDHKDDYLEREYLRKRQKMSGGENEDDVKLEDQVQKK